MEGQPHHDHHEHDIDPTDAEQTRRVKTLGIRIDEDLHAQLTFIAQLGGNTIADEIRGAIEQRIAAAQTDPDLIARADEVSREIEREAAARRAAISGFLGHTALDTPAPDAQAPAVSRKPRSRATPTTERA